MRTVEDVKKVIEHAKLVENDLRPNVQPIYFSETFEKYKLLELDNYILSDLKCGQTYVSIYLCLYNISGGVFKRIDSKNLFAISILFLNFH